jgi:hypothetical protein
MYAGCQNCACVGSFWSQWEKGDGRFGKQLQEYAPEGLARHSTFRPAKTRQEPKRVKNCFQTQKKEISGNVKGFTGARNHL